MIDISNLQFFRPRFKTLVYTEKGLYTGSFKLNKEIQQEIIRSFTPVVIMEEHPKTTLNILWNICLIKPRTSL